MSILAPPLLMHFLFCPFFSFLMYLCVFMRLYYFRVLSVLSRFRWHISVGTVTDLYTCNSIFLLIYFSPSIVLFNILIFYLLFLFCWLFPALSFHHLLWTFLFIRMSTPLPVLLVAYSIISISFCFLVVNYHYLAFTSVYLTICAS